MITHDLSQISDTDFVYVLKEGAVVEHGYRGDLEVAGGEFQQMAMAQAEAGGFALKDEHEYSPEAVRKHDEEAEKIFRSQSVRSSSVRAVKHERMGFQLVTVGNWMFEVVSDLTRSGRRGSTQPTSIITERNTTQRSRFVPVGSSFVGVPEPLKGRPSTLAIDIPSPSPAHTTVSRHLSLQFSPISPVHSLGLSNSSIVDGDSDSEGEKKALTHVIAWRQRFYDGASGKRVRKRWDAIKVEPFSKDQPSRQSQSRSPRKLTRRKSP